MKANSSTTTLDVIIPRRALTWIEANLSHFDPLNQGQQPDETRQTALAELSLLCFLLLRRELMLVNNYLDKFLNLVEAVYRRPHIHEYIYHAKYAFTGHLSIWLALAHRGVNSLVPREKIQWMLDEGGITSIERTPYRSLELRYLLELGGFRHTLPEEASLFCQTTLGRGNGLISLMDSDIYNITHTIFYLTDFGMRCSPMLRGGRRIKTLRLIETLIGMVIQARSWDLVGELILSWRCLEADDGRWVRIGWEALSMAQRPGGIIAEDSYSLADLSHDGVVDQHLFDKYYHRTLVAIMAGFLGRQSRHAK